METEEEKLSRWAQEEARDRERTRKRRTIISWTLGIVSLVVSLLTLVFAVIAFMRA